MVDRWCEDADRVRTVDTRLKAVGVSSVDVIAMLREVGERALVELSEAEPTGLEQELDNRLADLIDQMTSGLRDLRVIRTDKTFRRDPADLEDVLPDDFFHASEGEPDTGREKVATLRALFEIHAMKLSRNREWVAAGILNRLNIGTEETVPSDARLPKPLQGANAEQVRMWPALWLAGEREVFPRRPGHDPRRVRRGQLIRELTEGWLAFLKIARENDEFKEDNRGN